MLNTGALDHEIVSRLALADSAQKRVRVSLDRTETAVRMSITDDGEGFDWSQYLDLDRARSTDRHGRGIAMAKTLSFDKLDFRGCGNQVVVSVSLKGIDADSWPEEERGNRPPPSQVRVARSWTAGAPMTAK